MNFKDRIGTASFSLKDKDSGKTYTMKLQANFMNLKKFEAATGTDNPLYYLTLHATANAMTAPVEIIFNFMIDFFDNDQPSKSLINHMDRDNIMGWLMNADDEDNKGCVEDIKKAITVIMGEQYERLLAEAEKKSKKKADDEAA